MRYNPSPMRESKSTLIDYDRRNPFKEAMVGTARCISYSIGPMRRAVRQCIQELPDLQEAFAGAETVLLKPNLLSCTRGPDKHVNTHPRLVQALAETLISDFSCRVSIGDSCGSFRSGSTAEAIRVSEMDKVAETVGASIYNVDTQPRHVVPFERGRVMKEFTLTQNLDQFDLIVSVAKLKTHMLTLMTGAVKNTLGLVPGEAKKRCHMAAPKPEEFATLLADLYDLVHPQATFIDAVIAMEGGGPAHGELRHLELVAASCDGVALDSFCAQVMGLRPMDVPLLAQCHERGLGIAEPADIIVRGEPAEAFALDDFALPRTYARRRPRQAAAALDAARGPAPVQPAPRRHQPVEVRTLRRVRPQLPQPRHPLREGQRPLPREDVGVHQLLLLRRGLPLRRRRRPGRLAQAAAG